MKKRGKKSRDEDAASQYDGPSKSQVKRDLTALQEIGVSLLDLPQSQVDDIGLPEPLAGALQEARRITSHEAKRRHLQLIGKLMREVDPAPIRAALDAAKGRSNLARAQQRQQEQWRERLIKDDAALTEFAGAHPGADIQALRTLIRNARKEIAESKPPRAQREIFRIVRELTTGGSL